MKGACLRSRGFRVLALFREVVSRRQMLWWTLLIAGAIRFIGKSTK
jgi:hypothetical protein